MTDPAALVALASAGTAAFGIVAAASLRGWQGWLDLRRMELSSARSRRSGRIAAPEIGELRERVKRLEAIADGAAL